MEKRLYRSRSDRMIWGVCSGLAKYFAIDPVIVRLIAILLIFAGGVGILTYIILAIITPMESSQVTEPKDVIKENVEEMKETASQIGQEIRATFAREERRAEETAVRQHRTHNILGIILIIIGILFLLANFNFDLFWWLQWQYLWPLIIITIGLLIIFSTRRK
ncbi:MAG: PspC domain-containing protein [Chloroflexi bacterium]|nr:PspC domain-containing protein [Chloroflexota bacterium]